MPTSLVRFLPSLVPPAAAGEVVRAVEVRGGSGVGLPAEVSGVPRLGGEKGTFGSAGVRPTARLAGLLAD